MDSVAFTFGDSKEASLYFDHIVPIGSIIDVIEEHGPELFKSAKSPDQIPWNEYIELQKTYAQLLPPVFRGGAFSDELADINMGVILKHVNVIPGVTSPKVAAEVASAKRNNSRKLQQFIRRVGISEPNFTASAQCITRARSSADDVQITISNLNLIDVSKVSMEKILAFREDQEARTKLRKLRLFAKQNYSGKTKEFVEDDLLARISDYDYEVRRWSFETKHAAISMLFRSKILAGAAGGSLIGAIVGEPGISLGSLTVGAIAEFGNIWVEVARKKFEARAALRASPVSYIVETNEALTKSQK